MAHGAGFSSRGEIPAARRHDNTDLSNIDLQNGIFRNDDFFLNIDITVQFRPHAAFATP